MAEKKQKGLTREQKYNREYYARRKEEINETKREKYRKDSEYRKKAMARSKRQYWMKTRPSKMEEKEEVGAELASIPHSAVLNVTVDNPKDRRHGQTIPVKVYTTPKIGELFGRSALTIRLWLRNDVIPEPFFRGAYVDQKVAKGKNPRLYTEDEMKVFESCREYLRLPQQTQPDSVFSRCVKEGFSRLVQGLQVEPKDD